MRGRRVGIIGAGTSGLLACKYVLEKGFEPIVFESQPGVGGVWTHTPKTTKLQTSKQAYEFSDFPWPSSVNEEYPNHNQALEYLESYSLHFGLLPYIKFNTKVINIDYFVQQGKDNLSSTDNCFSNPKRKWEITTTSAAAVQQDQDPQVYEVEFVILCIGRFGGIPNIPDFPPNKGPDAFVNGKVIHSMNYSAMGDSEAKKFVKGKRVTVIGFRKSALDIANECATANGVENPCTLIYRKLHWNIPADYDPYSVLASLYLNRFSELMLHKPGEGRFLSLLVTLLSPLRWAVSRCVESYIKFKLPLKKYDLVPEQRFSADVTSCSISIAPENFYDRIEEGSTLLKKSKGFGFYANGLTFDDDATAPLETDIVILCTGYKGDVKLKNIFKSQTFQNYITGVLNPTVSLYRECIHPRIPQLAVVGYSDSYSNLYTSEMRCRWLAHFLVDGFKLPSIEEMEKDMLEWEKYMKRYSSRGACIGTVHVWYNDQLFKDMGFNHKRKKGFFAELFEPYGPTDYANLTPGSK
ncbi:hypothetical protein MKW98_003593 [Papaver atlanticum]|uniref:Flavin-containing monooxygenase n=1 Tax=Papaver atlanticum TaxID=357466 RepID=A0AAD4SIZ6_9MAGN|nr:hypothetical protein MKW98_003593 [Papaver atlanticum]